MVKIGPVVTETCTLVIGYQFSISNTVKMVRRLKRCADMHCDESTAVCRLFLSNSLVAH